MKIFTEALETLESEPAIKQVLKRLCDLYALHGILTNTGDFLHDGFLSGAQIDVVRTAYLDLLLLIRWVAGHYPKPSVHFKFQNLQLQNLAKWDLAKAATALRGLYPRIKIPK